MEARVIFEGTSELQGPPAEQTASEVMENVAEILGYDVLADPAEGYVEMAEESLLLSETSMDATFESLTLED